MASSSSRETRAHLILLTILITSILYTLQKTTLLQTLTIGHAEVTIKRSAPDLPLRFASNGAFKILQVADMHFGNGDLTRCKDVAASEFEFCSDLNTTRFVRRLIEVENPDFVAFTGDNIFGASSADAAESLVRAFKPVMESKIPWAAVLGNHDQESTMNRRELMHFISLMDYSVSQINPSSDSLSNAGSDNVIKNIDGFGNYNLRVYGAPGSDLANTSILNLFFLDSGDRATVGGIRTYDWIKESQLHWLRSITTDGSQANERGIDPDPALTFFHIPVLEVRDLWFKEFVGQFQEGVACSIVNSGVLDTLVSRGDVKAVFMGHDHNNDFCGQISGIWFCYGGGSGYHGYGKAGWQRRARVIVAELEKGKRAWMRVQRIKTWKRIDDEKLSKFDEQILWHHSS
ncbi:hypothetical protein Sjap_022977 [Stephania japonica]|uniref:Calcineurin-like phosphoesterase domain-containing protein n=1 Tax=Stephania japonica TaxID=461633 RepID=A0AAP0EPV4_9MAGN